VEAIEKGSEKKGEAMKTTACVGLMIAVLVVLTIGLAGQSVAGGWSWVHGNVAIIQSAGNTNWNRYIDMGLDLDQKHDTTTWIHIPLQSPIMASTAQADAIQLFMAFGSTDMTVTAVRVLNGAWRVLDVPITPFTTPSPGYYFYKEIPLGGTYGFGLGMGISLEIKAGKNSSMDHRFCLASAGANWVGAMAQSGTGNTLHSDGDQGRQIDGEQVPINPPPPRPWKR
jgi:hypothetical protein